MFLVEIFSLIFISIYQRMGLFRTIHQIRLPCQLLIYRVHQLPALFYFLKMMLEQIRSFYKKIIYFVPTPYFIFIINLIFISFTLTYLNSLRNFIVLRCLSSSFNFNLSKRLSNFFLFFLTYISWRENTSFKRIVHKFVLFLILS